MSKIQDISLEDKFFSKCSHRGHGGCWKWIGTRTVKARLLRGDRPIDIARQLGVSNCTVSLINKGKSWKHVKIDNYPGL